MPKVPKNLIVKCEDVLYIRTDAVMNPLIPFIDGLPLHFFKRSKKSYLSFDTAINWCKREMGEYDEKRIEEYGSVIRELERIAEMNGIDPYAKDGSK
jgi:hypothetical protein